MSHKRDRRVGPPIPRIRDDSRLMRMHESMVDYLTGRSSCGTFMHMLAPSFFGLNVFESFGDDLIYSDDEDDSHLFDSLEPHPQIKQLSDEEEGSFIKEERDEDIRRRDKTEKNKRKKMRKKAKKRMEKENALRDTSLEENHGDEDSENPESLFKLHEDSQAKDFSESQMSAEAAGSDDKEGDVRAKKKGNHLLKDSQDLDFQSSAAPSVPAETQKLPRNKGKGVEEQPKATHNHEEYLDVEDLWTLFAEASFEETRDQKTTKEEEDEAQQNKHTPVKKEQDSTAQAAVDRPAEEFAKRSVDLANAGNRLAASGQFELAVKCFTDAIRYNPMEFKLFGNRSLCFERLQQYGNALRDAELALSLEPNWIKGLFRKGKALCGLKRYYEASLVYKEVLKLDSASADAVQELKKAQTLHLMEMGFSWAKSSEALKAHGSLEEAVEALFAADAGPGPAAGFRAESAAQQEEDDDEGEWVILQRRSSRSPQSRKSDAQDQTRPKSKSPPSRSLTKESLSSVWVGTLAPSMTYVKLHELFSRAGTVYSIKMLLEQKCALIYYTKREDCEQAIHCLHGMVVDGAPLSVRYPFNGGKSGSADGRSSLQKKECFFWRTTGCTRPDCTFKHLPEHKNIDKDKFTSRLGQVGHQ
ncbi:hsp70-Hsp90 organizing protein 2 [Oryzias melastigma]|uniref:Hsp70-Hsp90 organizing protein 2-like n=1 Tax=Oryzias melastigma TaxID=30732 RepID=A0A3B3DAB9_ORYME|nr:hsp70-Hsp90 organizing protein 2 [Oryzias melastigma]